MLPAVVAVGPASCYPTHRLSAVNYLLVIHHQQRPESFPLTTKEVTVTKDWPLLTPSRALTYTQGLPGLDIHTHSHHTHKQKHRIGWGWCISPQNGTDIHPFPTHLHQHTDRQTLVLTLTLYGIVWHIVSNLLCLSEEDNHDNVIFYDTWSLYSVL